MKKYLFLIIMATAFGCNDSNKGKGSIYFLDLDSLQQSIQKINKTEINKDFNQKYENFEPKSIIIDSTKYYVVEGDLLLNEYYYTQYQLSKLISVDTTLTNNKLILNVENNVPTKWPQNYIITYCIARNTFQSVDKYNLVKENMKKAISEWEATCKVKFLYAENKDANNIFTPTPDLTFVVVGFDSGNSFIASAFFPNSPPNERRLLIDPSYFTTTFDKIGILRHELGHTLGFRHEHIRVEAPLICQGEKSNNSQPITLYDPKSVMHYFCGGMGSIKLEITDLDRQGSQFIYGLPIK